MQVIFYENTYRNVVSLPILKNTALFSKINVNSGVTTNFKLRNAKYTIINDYIYKNWGEDSYPYLSSYNEKGVDIVKRHGSMVVVNNILKVLEDDNFYFNIDLSKIDSYDSKKTVIFPLLKGPKNNPIALIANKDKVGIISAPTSWVKQHLLKKVADDKNRVLTTGIYTKRSKDYATNLQRRLDITSKTIGEILTEDPHNYKTKLDNGESFSANLSYLYGFTYEQLNKMLPGKRKIPKNAKFFDNYEDYKKLENIYTNNTFIPYKTDDGKYGILLEDSVNITGLNLDNIDAVVSSGFETLFTAIHTKDNKVDIYMSKEGDREAKLIHSFDNVKSINRLLYRDLPQGTSSFLIQYANGDLKQLLLNNTTGVSKIKDHFEHNFLDKVLAYQYKILFGKFDQEDAKNFLKENCK